MKGVRELKSRLKGVKNIKKITKAMEMVASTKLRRLQQRSQATRPFAGKIEEMMQRVSQHIDPSFSPLLQVPEKVEDEALIVVGADRGLCGAFNMHLFRKASETLGELKAEGVTPHVYVFGRKPDAFLRKLKDLDYVGLHDGTVEKIEYPSVKKVMTLLSRAFVAGEFQRVRVLYTRMKSMVSFEPTVQELLPIAGHASAEDAEDEAAGVDYILEPSPRALMDSLLPRYLEMQLFAAILESLTSEFASRRMAMKNATDSADEMTEALTMEYNKARQSGITGDLLDIVGGVFGLEG